MCDFVGDNKIGSNFLVKLKLFMPAGEASVSPPLGPMLSQYGMNTVQFCKEFNEKTIEFTSFFNDECNSGGGLVESKKFILVVYMYMYFDKTFVMEIMKPTVQFLLITFLCMDVPKPNKLLYTMSLNDLVLLAKFKFPFLKLFSACMLVSGVASSLGIRIKS